MHHLAVLRDLPVSLSVESLLEVWSTRDHETPQDLLRVDGTRIQWSRHGPPVEMTGQALKRFWTRDHVSCRRCRVETIIYDVVATDSDSCYVSRVCPTCRRSSASIVTSQVALALWGLSSDVTP